MSIKFQSAVLFVQDVAQSRHFYESLLGQTVETDFGANVGYHGGFAIWQVNSVNQIVFGKDHISGTQGRDNIELYFETADLDGIQQTLTGANVSILQPLFEQPWGQRALRVYDPDRHIVEIAEPMPAVVKRLLDAGQAVQLVAERTMMPVELVQYVAEHGEFPTA